MPLFEITKMRTCHIEGAAQIEAECFSAPFKKEDFERYLNDTLWHIFVASDSLGTPLGHISFYIIADTCQIANVAVSKNSRRLGIGYALCSKMISFAKEMGVCQFFLEVRKSNTAAISLYERLGFTTVYVSRDYYSQPKEDALFMNLEIR